eukprot:CAMPEP_0184319240 /NCGR_PEP_ID=MMETSP1049-20130417/107229_1 /TAXON_ID=77928 /ORGANISM="Proteomonas sulcata, Strain CCMP704" /LENGTH=426 /DNA_ID=CAMNT_0026639297 /DNA_START=307 /DNA_END=1587 /DNA_ORIENTATION=+
MSVEIPRRVNGLGGYPFDSPAGLARTPSYLNNQGSDLEPPPQNWTDNGLAAAFFPSQGVKTPTRPLDATEVQMVGDNENFVNEVLDGQKLDDETPRSVSSSVPLLLRECSTRVLSDDDLPQMIREDSTRIAAGPPVDQEPESLIDPYNRHLSNNLGFDKALPPAATEELEKDGSHATEVTQEAVVPETIADAEVVAEAIPYLPTEKQFRRLLSGRISVPVSRTVVEDTRSERRSSVGKRRASEELAEEEVGAKRSKKAIAQKSAKDKADMQKWARKGQEHWGKQVREMRQEWQDREMWKHDSRFADQIAMCTRAHVKSQHECILRELQKAKVEGLIHSCKFSDSEGDSFLGWKSFKIANHRNVEFRKRIEGLFVAVPLENTLNNVFRRAGLLPDHCPEEGRTRSWEEAWRGLSSFVYVCEKRAVYS